MQNQKPKLRLSLQKAGLSTWRHGLVVNMVASVGVAAIVGSPSPAQANTLTQWSFDSASNQLEVRLQSPTTPRYFLMAQPARIVLDLPGATVGSVPTQQTFKGPVRQIRVSQFQPGLTRIVLELSPDATLAPGQVRLKQVGGQGSARWQLTPLLAGSVAQGNSSQPSAPTKPAAPKPVTPPKPASNQATKPATATVKPAAPTASVPATVAAPPPKPTSPPKPAAPTELKPPPATSSSGAASPAKLVDFPATLPPASTDSTSPGNDLALPPSDPPPASASSLSDKPLTLVGPPALLQTTATTQKPLSDRAGAPRSAVVSVPSPDTGMPASAAGRIKVGDLDIPSTFSVIAADKPTVQVPMLSNTASPSPQPLTPVVSVPPPGTPGKVSAPALPPSSKKPAATAPPSTSAANQPAVPARKPAPPVPIVTVPPVPTGRSAIPTSEPRPPVVDSSVAKARVQNVVEFGQPLPGKSAIGATRTALPPSPPASVGLVKPPVIQAQPPAPSTSQEKPSLSPQPQAIKLPQSNTLLPSGTILGLRYPGALPLSMTAGTTQREILLLEAEIRDSKGNLLAPAGSPVIGQFEQSGRGSRFVTQTITLRGEDVPLMAQSDVMNLTTNKVLQPGEVVYVRLLKDLR